MKVPVRYFLFCLRRYLLTCRIIFILSFTFLVFAFAKFISHETQTVRVDSVLNATKMKSTTLKTPVYLHPKALKEVMLKKKNNNLISEKNKTEMKIKVWREKIERLSKIRPKSEVRHVELNKTIAPNYNVHVFYYAWYGNLEVDGNWLHWNHKYLSNWKKNDRKVYPTGRHNPPDDIGSNYYPKLGCYSSRDPVIIDKHMKLIRNAGIGVLVVSWYPPGMSDDSSRSPDTVFSELLGAAEKHQLKLAPHVEPYTDRNPNNFRHHLKYFVGKYGNHPALYKMKKKNKELIVYYIYDSYRTPAFAWRELMTINGNSSLRGSPQDGIFLGLLVDVEHKHDIKKARFDGFYTYFASNGFSYGSSWKNWKSLATFARLQNLVFIPSIGPGYIDTRVRPWNSMNTRHRRNGKYYEVGWRAAIGAGVSHVSITSFNEWHEGTQIEPAMPKATKNFTYLDYEPEGHEFYMNLTKFWINEFGNKFRRNVPIL